MASQPFFYTEDGSSILLQNAGKYLPEYIAPFPFCYTENKGRSFLRMVGISLPGYMAKQSSY
jgi:hypothetical protein